MNEELDHTDRLFLRDHAREVMKEQARHIGDDDSVGAELVATHLGARRVDTGLVAFVVVALVGLGVATAWFLTN